MQKLIIKFVDLNGDKEILCFDQFQNDIFQASFINKASYHDFINIDLKKYPEYTNAYIDLVKRDVTITDDSVIITYSFKAFGGAK
jgi:hypothetical protein